MKNRIMQIKPEHLEQLELEIQHIFDSGANEVRVYEMIQTFIERRGKALFIPDVVEQSEQLCDGLHSTDFNGKCFKCGEQVFVREPK